MTQDEISLFPKASFVRQVKIFRLVVKMLDGWDSREAIATRKRLKESCHDYLFDIDNLHIYHEKLGICESLAGNLKSLQKKIDEQSFWIKLYCLFYEVLIEDEKYEHLLTDDKALMGMWKSNDDWRWLSNWPNQLVFQFVNCCITVILHGTNYSDELQKMFDAIAEWLGIQAHLVEKGCGSSKIPQRFGSEFRQLVDNDIHDLNFWLEFYCFLRLELKPHAAHMSVMTD